MTIPPALAIYLSLLVVPWLAGPSHRLLFVTSPSSPEFWIPVLALPALAIIFTRLVRNDHRPPAIYPLRGVDRDRARPDDESRRALPVRADSRSIPLFVVSWRVLNRGRPRDPICRSGRQGETRRVVRSRRDRARLRRDPLARAALLA